MSTGNQNTGLALLEATLETYGSDRTRWPAELRRQLSSVDSSNVEARRILAEAKALDRLIDIAPVVPADRLQALSDRIVMAARTTPRVVGSSSLPGRKPTLPMRRENFAAGMALAASLVLGMFAGSQQAVVPALQDLAGAAGLASDATINQADASDDSDIYSNEDVL